jgi:hypothetical protein
MVGPPLDNWSTEDVTAVVCKFGHLLVWENDERHKGRIIAKVICTELQEIPKSIRLTDGDNLDTESWTFSIEVLQQTLLGAGPQDEYPAPEDGADPHPLPPVNFVPPPVQQNGDNMEWGDEQWDPDVQQANNNLNNLANAADNVEGNAEGLEHSSLTVTISLSAGEQSNNNPIPQVNALNEEVNQQEANQQLDDNMQFFQEDAVIHVHVQGDAQALNMDNFIELGIGMQNIMMAYHDIDLDSEEDVEEEVSQPENDDENDMLLDDNLSDPNLEMFHFNDFVPPEVAHLQLGMVKTHFFPRKDTDKFSSKGMLLWEKYFAPHIMEQMNNSSCKVLEIPTNWFNFITLMLLTPEKV